MDKRKKNCKYREQSGYCAYADMECNLSSVRCALNVPQRHTVQATNNSDHASSNGKVNYVVPTKPKRPVGYEVFALKPTKNSAGKQPARRLITVDFSGDKLPRVVVFSGALQDPNNEYDECRVIVRDIMQPSLKYVICMFKHRSLDYYDLPSTILEDCHKRNRYPALDIIVGSHVENAYLDGTRAQFHVQSILNVYGYKVGKTKGAPKAKRQAILRFLLKNHIMSSREIISLLQMNISLRMRSCKDYSYSIRQWKEDIVFVGSLR